MTQPTVMANSRGVMDARPGLPTPMGSTPDAKGTNFAVYSASATEGGVSLCLFGDDSTETRVPVTARTGDVWHAYVPGIGAGQRYGYRLNGPWTRLPAGGQPGQAAAGPLGKGHRRRLRRRPLRLQPCAR
jgi:pullulanase/glycogen debranching enzyme